MGSCCRWGCCNEKNWFIQSMFRSLFFLTRYIRKGSRYLWNQKLIIIYILSCCMVISNTHHSLKVLKPFKHEEMAWRIGGVFVFITIPLALHLAYQHLSNFVNPKQQSQTVRIICTIPIYAISAWLCLFYPEKAKYIHGIREFYEAYVLYCFLLYMIFYIGSNRLELAAKLKSKPSSEGFHKPPFSLCLKSWPMGLEFLDNCRLGVLQLVLVRLFTTLLAIYCHHRGVFGEGSLSFKTGFVYVTVLNSSSQACALYSLFMFFHATSPDMTEIRPLGKFLTIKSIVFLSFWQGVLIGVLLSSGKIPTVGQMPAEVVARGMKDLLVCVEMLGASIAYLVVFPLTDFVSPSSSTAPPSPTQTGYTTDSLFISPSGTRTKDVKEFQSQKMTEAMIESNSPRTDYIRETIASNLSSTTIEHQMITPSKLGEGYTGEQTTLKGGDEDGKFEDKKLNLNNKVLVSSSSFCSSFGMKLLCVNSNGEQVNDDDGKDNNMNNGKEKPKVIGKCLPLTSASISSSTSSSSSSSIKQMNQSQYSLLAALRICLYPNELLSDVKSESELNLKIKPQSRWGERVVE